MGTYKPIRIACPQYEKLMSGTYECDESGQYLLGPDGEFLLGRTRCDQHGGRCMETLCALHRHNRGGPATWFPGKVLAMPKQKKTRKRPEKPSTDGGAPGLY